MYFPVLIICFVIIVCHLKELKFLDDIGYLILIHLWKTILILTFFICQSAFLGMIIHYNLSYNCSDDITNELLRKENEKTKNNIIFIAINFGLDAFNLFIDLIYYLTYYIYIKCLNYKNKKIIEQNRIEIEKRRNEVHAREIIVEKIINNMNEEESVRKFDANRENNINNEQQNNQQVK